MNKRNTFTWTRLLRTMVALLVIMGMLLCGCAKSDDGGDKSDGGNKGGQPIFGDGDGKLEAQDVVDSITNLYGALLNAGGGNQPDNFSYEMDLEVTVGDSLLSQLGAILGQAGMGSDVSWFKSIGLTMNMNTKGDLIQAMVDAKLNGKKIISADVIVDMLGEMTYIGVPELNDQYIGGEVNFDQMPVMPSVGTGAMDNYAEIMKALPTDEQINKVLTHYLEVILENLDEPTTGNVQLSFGGISQKVDTTVYSFNQLNAIEIVEQVMIAAKSDSDLEKVLDGLSEALNIQGQQMANDGGYRWTDVDLHADMIDGINGALETVDEAKANADTTPMIMLTVYGGDNATGLKLEVNNGYGMAPVVDVYSLKDGKDTALYADFGGVLQLTGTGKNNGGKLSGEYELSSYGEAYLYIELKDFDINAMQTGEMKGTVRLSMGRALRVNMGSSLPISEDTVIELVFSGGDKAKTTINLYDGDTFLFGFSIATKLTSGSNIKVPSDYANAESSSQMSSWLEGMKFDGILSNLKSAGVPSTLMDMLEEALENGIFRPVEKPSPYPEAATRPAY